MRQDSGHTIHCQCYNIPFHFHALPDLASARFFICTLISLQASCLHLGTSSPSLILCVLPAHFAYSAAQISHPSRVKDPCLSAMPGASPPPATPRILIYILRYDLRLSDNPIFYDLSRLAKPAPTYKVASAYDPPSPPICHSHSPPKSSTSKWTQTERDEVPALAEVRRDRPRQSVGFENWSFAKRR